MYTECETIKLKQELTLIYIENIDEKDIIIVKIDSEIDTNYVSN